MIKSVLGVVIVLASGVLDAASPWQQIVGPDASTAAGFGSEAMQTCHALELHGGRLWAVVSGPPPHIAATHTELWRSEDGLHWSLVGQFDENAAEQPLAEFSGEVYLATVHGLWRYRGGVEWTMITPRALAEGHAAATSLIAFSGQLYLGVVADLESDQHASEIWRSSDGWQWDEVWRVTADPDLLETFQSVGLMAVLDGSLYVENLSYEMNIDYDEHGSVLWRTDDGRDFQRLVSFSGRSSGDGLQAMATYGGLLVAGLGYSRTGGGELWCSSDGESWQQCAEGGFGNDGNISCSSLEVFSGGLFVGTSNGVTGAELWRGRDVVHWRQVDDGGFSADEVKLSTLRQFRGRLYAVTEVYGQGIRIWRHAESDAPE